MGLHCLPPYGLSKVSNTTTLLTPITTCLSSRWGYKACGWGCIRLQLDIPTGKRPLLWLALSRGGGIHNPPTALNNHDKLTLAFRSDFSQRSRERNLNRVWTTECNTNAMTWGLRHWPSTSAWARRALPELGRESCDYLRQSHWTPNGWSERSIANDYKCNGRLDINLFKVFRATSQNHISNQHISWKHCAIYDFNKCSIYFWIWNESIPDSHLPRFNRCDLRHVTAPFTVSHTRVTNIAVFLHGWCPIQHLGVHTCKLR